VSGLADRLAELVLEARRAGGDAVPLEQLEALDEVRDALRRRRVLDAVAERLRRRPGLSVRSACDGVARVEGFSPHTIRTWWATSTLDERGIQNHEENGSIP
jgi:hypothetical protein